MSTCRWKTDWDGISIEVTYRALPFAEGLPSLGLYSTGEIHADGRLLAQVASDSGEFGAFDVTGEIDDKGGTHLPILARLRPGPDAVRCEIRVASVVLSTR